MHNLMVFNTLSFSFPIPLFGSSAAFQTLSSLPLCSPSSHLFDLSPSVVSITASCQIHLDLDIKSQSKQFDTKRPD